MQFSFNDLKLRGFAGHTAAIRTFAVNEPAKIFASGSRDKTVKIWSLNVHQGIENWENDPFSESLVTYTGHRRGTINDVHFLSTGGLNDIVASCDGHVHVSSPYVVFKRRILNLLQIVMGSRNRHWIASVQCR
jgi:WD40 repeat protein